ncbi:hypothetical protein [Streptomyces decoyicus]|uniref:hypothetical protein n=1 Tax=Streptomyces decoyicus TaxID=249567 RepID=UPI0038227638
MLADEPARPRLVEHGLAPVLRGEGDVDGLAVLTECGDVLAAGALVPHGVRKRVQHPPVLGRRGEVQLLREVEHHRPVPADLPVQQHFPEVAVMRGDLLDLLVLPREPAEALHRLGDHPQAAGLYQLSLCQGEHGRGDLPAQAPGDLFHRRCLVQPFQGLHGLGGHRRGLRQRLLGGAAVVEVLEHGAVVPDQGLDDLPLGEPDLLQLLLGFSDLHGNPLAEHGRQIVPHPHPGLVGEAGQQRDPLDGRVVPQFGGVPRICFSGEVGDLRRRDAVHPHRGVAELVQPLQVREQALEVRPARSLGGLLQPIVVPSLSRSSSSRSIPACSARLIQSWMPQQI